MALIQTMLGRMSGKLAGVVFSSNKGGQYVRQRVTGTNPATPFQSAVRDATNYLSNLWVTLTPAQRAGWENYAANVTLPNRLGNPIQIPAMAHFVRSNVPRMQAIGVAAVVLTAPITYNLGEYTAPTGDAPSVATTDVAVTFNDADAWAGEVGSHLLLYASRPQDETVNFFKGPYRLAGNIPGAVVPPAPPQTLDLPFPFGLGDRVFFQARVSRVDGRLSYATNFFGTAVA